MLNHALLLLQLANTEEFNAEGVSQGMLGEVMIRCNNVLYLREIGDEDEKKPGLGNGAMES